MSSFTTLHRRVERTRGWLNTMIRQNTITPIEDLDDVLVDIDFSDESASSFGVQSLSEHTFADEQDSLGGADNDDDAQSDASTAPFSEEECPLCLWLLNGWRFGKSYLSDGTAGYNAVEGAKHLSNARKAAINYEPHAGDDYTAFRNDHWDGVRQENWCYICEAPWGQCVGFRTDFEVDGTKSMASEPSADGKSWTLRWEPEIRPKENRAPAVLPYTKQDWIAEGYVGLYTDDDA